MRFGGVLLLVLGLVAAVAGTFSGCGALFTWNGRHAIATVPIGDGPITEALIPRPGRRYTVSVQVTFHREGLPKEEGVTQVEAKMPLVVRVTDPMGTSLAATTGWLDPNEPPNVLYGQTVREPQRSRTSQEVAPLVVERLVGPFMASSDAALSVHVDLGADRVGTARVASRCLVIHDDRVPPSIRRSFIVAGAGGAAFFAGALLIAVGWLGRRRAARKRCGIRADIGV